MALQVLLAFSAALLAAVELAIVFSCAQLAVINKLILRRDVSCG
jgi:hypothetical protein